MVLELTGEVHRSWRLGASGVHSRICRGEANNPCNRLHLEAYSGNDHLMPE
jgi:hypothetical protein